MRVYSMADAIALDAETYERLRYGDGPDYKGLVPVAQFHRDLDKPACLPERVVGYSVADEPRRDWPAPDDRQGRLL